jgi:hypothetical protein
MTSRTSAKSGRTYNTEEKYITVYLRGIFSNYHCSLPVHNEPMAGGETRAAMFQSKAGALQGSTWTPKSIASLWPVEIVSLKLIRYT